MLICNFTCNTNGGSLMPMTKIDESIVPFSPLPLSFVNRTSNKKKGFDP